MANKSPVISRDPHKARMAQRKSTESKRRNKAKLQASGELTITPHQHRLLKNMEKAIADTKAVSSVISMIAKTMPTSLKHKYKWKLDVTNPLESVSMLLTRLANDSEADVLNEREMDYLVSVMMVAMPNDPLGKAMRDYAEWLEAEELRLQEEAEFERELEELLRELDEDDEDEPID